ncbi:MAG: hypothetical protein N2037_12525 [Acidimicrobiales bacterium]|nr:hypothetical protein [Acidimicrobiales bacterium]
MEQPTTSAQITVPEPASKSSSSPGTTGALVFFTVMAVIVIGALVLYAKHRPRRSR